MAHGKAPWVHQMRQRAGEARAPIDRPLQKVMFWKG